MFADLHIHSWYSDGTLSPEEIVKKAKSQNITLISICDHNLFDAYSELHDIDFITGAEIHAVMDDKEYHILAYNFDMKNKAINELLQYNRDVLFDRGKKLIKNISADYPTVSSEEFSKYERNRKNGGWEGVDYLKSKRLLPNGITDYFNFMRKYGSPPDKDFLSPVEVIKIIHDARGYAVLAHIGEYIEQNITNCEKTAAQFFDIGIDGFECYYPHHIVETTDFLVKFCREHDLMITAGSDEHGEFAGLTSRGNYIGAVKIKIEQLNLKNLMAENLLRNSAWLFDVDHRDNLTDDIKFYTDYAKNLNCKNILELGCGTGRVALILAKEGFNVTGLDLSNEMLDVFKQKLEKLEKIDDNIDNIKDKIELIHGNMADFNLNKKFDLIIAPFRAFQCLTDEKDIENSLNCIKNHLTDNGIFIINVFNTDPNRMNENWCYPLKIQWERLDENTGNYVIKKDSGDKIDLQNRIIYVTFVYEVKDKSGNISVLEDKLKLKYYYENDLTEIIENAGLKIKEKFGWYDKTSVEETKRELIFVCGK